MDGKELEVVEADGSGTFAILTTIPTGEKPLELQLEDANDNSMKSKDTVLVIPNKETENKSQKLLLLKRVVKLLFKIKMRQLHRYNLFH